MRHPTTPAERLAALQGRWRVMRALRHADGTRARFEGIATWDGAHCAEAGTLRAGGGSFPARRDTMWRVRDGALAVDFRDGRPFHIVGSDRPHLCGADRYVTRYRFDAWPRWSCRWRVHGPAKDYAALTWYRPIG